MKYAGLEHIGYHRVLVKFVFNEISKSTLDNLANYFGAKNFGKRKNAEREYFFDFDEHPVRFLEELSKSEIAEDYYIEGEPFRFDI